MLIYAEFSTSFLSICVIITRAMKTFLRRIETYVSVLALALGIFSLASVAFAETTSSDVINGCPFYVFGSVTASLSSPTLIASAGTNVPFTATIKNTNSYPIVGATLLVSVRSATSSPSVIVNRFFADTAVDLAAESSGTITFPVSIPPSAATGLYFVDAYVVSPGLLIDTLAGAPDAEARIYVNGNSSFPFFIDQSALEINSASSSRMSGNFIEGTSSIVVSATVRNTTNSTTSIPVSWNVFSGFGTDNSSPIDTVSQNVTVSPKGQTNISYNLSDSRYPIYDVVLEAYASGMKSFGETGVSRAVSNPVPEFLSAVVSSTSPQVTVSECFYNFPDQTSSSTAFASIGLDGKTVASYAVPAYYSFGIEQTFGLPFGNSLNVSGSIQDGGKNISSISSDYGCADFGEICVQTTKTIYVFVEIFAGIIIVLVLLAIYEHRKSRKVSVPPTQI